MLESTTQAGALYQDNHMPYDVLRRPCRVGNNQVNSNMKFDKIGHRMRIHKPSPWRPQ